MRRNRERPGTRKEASVAHERPTFVCGRRPVEELLRHQPGRVLEVLYCNEDHVVSLQENFKAQGVIWTLIEKERLSEICDTTMHQGLAVRLSPKAQVGIKDLIARSLGNSHGHGLIVALDQVVDPQNVGAIIRAAEVLGADGVILTRDNSSGVTDTVRRVSRGASELTMVAEVTNLHRSLLELKEEGFWIVGADSNGDRSQSLYETNFTRPLALVLGSEGKGLRRLTLDQCDLVVNIPQSGLLDSLNVSQAAAVILSEIQRGHLLTTKAGK